MNLENNWQYKTLENLEKDSWPKPDFDSHLVTRTNQLRKIALNEFSVEDLRIMIGQNFGLSYLIPLSLDKLKENVVAEGDFYPGDLLVAVTSVEDEFWAKNPDYRRCLQEIIQDNLSLILNSKLKVDRRFMK